MARSQSVLSDLLEAFRVGEGVDLIRDAVQLVLQELIEVEATEQIGTARYERSDTRVTERNGGRPRLPRPPHRYHDDVDDVDDHRSDDHDYRSDEHGGWIHDHSSVRTGDHDGRCDDNHSSIRTGDHDGRWDDNHSSVRPTDHDVRWNPGQPDTDRA
jgi:hypothetical protein